MEDRTRQLREIHRSLVSLAAKEQFTPQRRKMLEGTIGVVADLIAAERPVPIKRAGYVTGVSLTSGVLGIVAAAVTFIAYWFG